MIRIKSILLSIVQSSILYLKDVAVYANIGNKVPKRK